MSGTFALRRISGRPTNTTSGREAMLCTRRWCSTPKQETTSTATTVGSAAASSSSVVPESSSSSSSSAPAVNTTSPKDSAVSNLGPHADHVSLKWDEIIASKTKHDPRYSRVPTGNVLADNTRALQTEILEGYTPNQRPIYSPQTGKKTFTRDASRGFRSVDGGKMLVSEQFLQHTGEGAKAAGEELRSTGPDAVDEYRPEEGRVFPPLPPQHVGRQRRHSYTEGEVGPYAPGGRLEQAVRDDIHKTTVVSVWDDPHAGTDDQMVRLLKARRDTANLSPTGMARKEREDLAKERVLYEKDPEEYYKHFYNDKHRVLDEAGNVLRGDSSLLGLDGGNRREQRHFQVTTRGDGAIPEDPVLLRNPDPKVREEYVYGRQYPSLPGRPPSDGSSHHLPPREEGPNPFLSGGGVGAERIEASSSPSDRRQQRPEAAMGDMLRALRGGGSTTSSPEGEESKETKEAKAAADHFEKLLGHASKATTASTKSKPAQKVINEAELRRDIQELNYWKDAAGYDDRLVAFQKKYPSHDPETGAPLVRKGLYSQDEIRAGLEGEPVDLRRASPALQAQLSSNPVSNYHPSILANELLASRLKPNTGVDYQSAQAKEMLALEAEMARHMSLKKEASENSDVTPRKDQRGALERITGLDPVQQKQVKLCMSDFDLKDGMTTLHVMQSYPYVDGLTYLTVLAIMATMIFLQDWYNMIDYYEEVIGLDSRTFPRARRYIYMGVTCVFLAVALQPITVGCIFATRVYRIALRRPVGPP